MIAYLLVSSNTPSQRIMEDLAERLQKANVQVEILDADSPRAIQFAENYDILGRPAVALVKDDGAPMQVWQGEEELPLLADIVYLASQ